MTFARSRIATLRRVSDGLLVGLILVVLLGVFLGRIVPLTGRQTLIVGGGSMEPAIPMGTAIVIEPVPPTELTVGDVVSLRTGIESRSVFTHRITRIIPRADGLWVETKGDANAHADPSITPVSQVIGRVDQTIPYAGFLLALLSVPIGVLFIILTAGCLIACSWLLESFEVDAPDRAGPVRRKPPKPVGRPARSATAPVPLQRAAEHRPD
jgi:signal peptidase